MYDFLNAEVEKVLNDPDYWRAFNKIAGNKLTVFYIHSPFENLKAHNPRIMPGQPINYMFRFSSKEDPGLITVPLLEEEFGIKEDIPLPALLFFQIENEKVSDFFVVRLKAETIEKSSMEIKGHMKEAVKSLSHILPENYQNHDEIFRELRRAIKERNTNVFLAKVLKAVPFSKLFSLLLMGTEK